MFQVQENAELVEVFALPNLARTWLPMSCADALIEAGRCRLAPALHPDGQRCVAEVLDRTMGGGRR